MAEATRIDVQTARQHITAGNALLVCGYDDEAKCRKIMLDGAMQLAQFREQLPTLQKDREVIFYCA